MSSKKCVVLVPFGGHIDSFCEQALHALERSGYVVRRVQGYSAIDLGRSVLATQALRDGFDEIMWVDSDIVFQPADVERLRSHQLPFVCALYAKKGKKSFAADFLPGTKDVIFGKTGGLHEIRYSGFGFVLTRRELYEKIRVSCELVECNQRFGPPVVPYFFPEIVPDGEGSWYLSEDYAFCERARATGFKIMADTSIRLLHIGTYGYSWDDIAKERK